MTSRPTIGLTLDSEPSGGYASQPWYAIRENCCAAVPRGGGLPVRLPYEPELAEDDLDGIDGLIVTGGAFDVDPAYFGAPPRHETVKTKDRRSAFELPATRAALARDLPGVGICGDEAIFEALVDACGASGRARSRRA